MQNEPQWSCLLMLRNSNIMYKHIENAPSGQYQIKDNEYIQTYTIYEYKTKLKDVCVYSRLFFCNHMRQLHTGEVMNICYDLVLN